MFDAAMTVIDTRGHRCPVPTLRLRKALAALPAGEVVELLADDPMARIDVPHFVREAGHSVQSMDLAGSTLSFHIRKVG